MVGKLGTAFGGGERQHKQRTGTFARAVIHVGCRAEEDSGDGMRWQREGASALHTDNYEVQSVSELKTKKLCPA